MTMQDHDDPVPGTSKRAAWNKGKLIGAKPPLRPKHVWSIRTKLQVEGRTRDLAMFNLAIDSKLRGCDVVALKVEDIAPSGYAIDRATVRQKKTGQPVKFELTEQTRQAVDDYLRGASRKPAEFLFSGRGDAGRCITTRQYARLVSEWIAGIGLDANRFRYTLPATNEGDLDLPPHWKPAGSPAFARPHADRKYDPISRHRGALAIAEQVDV